MGMIQEEATTIVKKEQYPFMDEFFRVPVVEMFFNVAIPSETIVLPRWARALGRTNGTLQPGLQIFSGL